MYAPIWPRTDIAFLSGLIRYLLDKDKIQHEYVKAYTNASPDREGRVRLRGRAVQPLYEETRTCDRSSWDYEFDEQGFANIDDSWQIRVASSTCSASMSRAIRPKPCRASAVRRWKNTLRFAN
jgi:anaerobic selenocysteine-containing dehydrogenase